MSGLSREAAIVGIGATEFSKESGRSELQLASEAVASAIADAGLTPADVDGMVTFTMDTNPEIQVAQAVGIGDLKLFSRIPYGGGAACGIVHQAVMAVATGVAEVVVCYRAFNERSERRYGQGSHNDNPTAEGVQMSHYTPFGFMTPAAWVAMFARRYMHEYGATSRDFGQISVTDRTHAANNPHAWFYEQPITIEQHQASRMIVDPLRLLDCCMETDGGQALVVTSVDRARDLDHVPAVIAGVAQGASRDQESMTSYHRQAISGLPEMGLVASQLWLQSGLSPTDIQTAVIYDHFTPFVLPQLEEFGFCARGEAKDFISGGNILLGGDLPLNTHGGQLGEAYLHGTNGIAEAVRQIRGTSVNQVEGATNVLVTAGTGVPTSGLILTTDT